VVELIIGDIVDLTIAENGAEGVDAHAAHDFDLILMDMQMPVMDGLAATRLIRERERAMPRGPTPIIVLTANALPEHIDAALQAGADRHLAKPISAPALIAAIEDVLVG
jgi:CheY-like chemotaxis protein